MKETPLTSKHISLGAKMAEFAGYNMPISYKGIIDEHKAVRNNVGVFDVSHMGEFTVKGKDAEAFLQNLTSNDVSALRPGAIQYSCLPNKTGGIVDDLLVYRMDDEADGSNSYLLVVNAGNMSKDWEWINAHKSGDVRLDDISEQTALLAIQGPKATAVLQKLTSINLSEIPYYHFRIGTVAGVENVIVSATGYTGSGGFEVYMPNEHIEKLWDQLFDIGDEYGIMPAGLGARDTLRLEMGFCLYGNDIDETTSPMEAGLGWITKLKKGVFNSSEIFKDQKEVGVSKKLIGFKLKERRVPRHDYRILNEEGGLIGRVTSGTMSPSLEYPIGMGYVETKYAMPGTVIQIEINNKLFAAEIVKIPFVQL
ncbi:MAG: glycine cleavage system aminomethyltransferase GcvT [Saprospiraceae bacterium]|nr:glycine cleavage system aminomethyltransferase GcvT [Candidatus Parvibacillus calidus]MBX2936422.1 glycine cleavage system aminomethyltransferase GcvT [Saprospiraceae bacterium]MCB0592076.1 glycine cleavage system aminomethyltransferase GcvT [Saprospiraceae bacterium]MCO5283083.1 glycine cleavage system aminomethyltransferase GcvT [Saprospiraceae bacterium]MCO6469797.1 glycine cleavage system aminomethyltransferase GcvT [Saprospiraceae bacterium]